MPIGALRELKSRKRGVERGRGREEGRKEGRKEGGKEGRKGGGRNCKSLCLALRELAYGSIIFITVAHRRGAFDTQSCEAATAYTEHLNDHPNQGRTYAMQLVYALG